MRQHDPTCPEYEEVVGEDGITRCANCDWFYVPLGLADCGDDDLSTVDESRVLSNRSGPGVRRAPPKSPRPDTPPGQCPEPGVERE